MKSIRNEEFIMDNGISTEKYKDLNSIKQETLSALQELLSVARLDKGDILVVGCSTSEVAKHQIGSFSNGEIGQAIFETLYEELQKQGINLATQCCEHLNRAIIMEKTVAKENRLTIVNVVPQIKAGGAFSTAAYAGFTDPVAVEYVQAQAGIDIGDTLIGMHLTQVAVPVRIPTKEIGSANVVCARTRPKYIGGERAFYNDNLS